MSTVEFNLLTSANFPLGKPKAAPQPATPPSGLAKLAGSDGSSSPASGGTEANPLQRIRHVRKQQGISVRSVARRTGVEPRQLREEEEPSADLRLSELRRWQKALDVPLIDLLEDMDEPVSRPVLERARLVKVMKTVQAIKEKTRDSSLLRLTEMLTEQLLEIMPELKDVGAWHSVGKRRSLDDMGRIGVDTVPDDFYRGEY